MGSIKFKFLADDTLTYRLLMAGTEVRKPHILQAIEYMAQKAAKDNAYGFYVYLTGHAV